ncbi:MAG: flavohemoglobin expression-modulating QEGLA motif protein [Salinivirgaceae bacterium]|nr:flavohemoglobin expression-modulating QEGLA motif protein [Salinivirgaceae bacterium]
MLKLSAEEIISRINNNHHFECECSDGSFYLKIEDYTPFVCYSIHNGDRLRPELKEKCLLNDSERWYEEDPRTLDFINSMPIVISGLDSRYEYDLNRKPDDAIYESAWGKEVWQSPLSETEREESLQKHHTFYNITKLLISLLENKFNSVLVFDIHSYNYKRIERETPVFNIGTSLITESKYRSNVNYFLNELNKFELPNIDLIARENDVFQGRGYLAEFISLNFDQVLVLPTEVKKVYCDEETGEYYPIVMDGITSQLKKAIVKTAGNFARKHTKLTVVKNNTLLSSDLDKNLLKTDKQLFELAKNFEILGLVNPINVEQAKREFFKSKYTKDPEFKYKQLAMDPFEFKRRLYKIPVEDIHDISLRMLYQDVIDSYADKIDIISTIGTQKFLYNSLRYFGEPSEKDIKNAEYIMHCSLGADDENQRIYNSQDVKDHFGTFVKKYGFQCKIDISKKVISKVLILNSKKTIRIRKDATFTEKSLHALSEHEIGVHMLTTVNARLQPLQVFRLGLPVNTHTQEGLAILSEYLSGNMTVERLKLLALRVLAIDKLMRGYSFAETFSFLMDTKMFDETQAFYLTARIYRGGGFTKDYLYLNGFRDILKDYNSNVNLMNLLIGKTTDKYLPIINELIERKIILPPKFKTEAFLHPKAPDSIISYILDGLD